MNRSEHGGIGIVPGEEGGSNENFNSAHFPAANTHVHDSVGTSRIDTTDQSGGDLEAVDPTPEGGSGLVSQLPGLSPTLLSTLAVLPFTIACFVLSLSGEQQYAHASKPLFELCKIGKEYVSDVYVAEEQARQTERIHTKEKRFARQLHMDAKKQASQLSMQEIEIEAEQHMQDVTAQLRESQKEADRDLWEQQNNEKQTLMMVSALLLAGAFQLTVEGQLPPETGGLLLLSDVKWADSVLLVDVYYASVGCALSLLLISILSAMFFTARMSRYMLSRTDKQQETLKRLRMIAYDQLKGIYQKEDATATTQPREDLYEQMKERLHQHRRNFSKRLWEQPVLVVPWNEINEGRHIVGFDDWYRYHCSYISTLTDICFNLGACFLMLSLALYVEAHLRYGDDEEEASSTIACIIFWICILVAIAMLLFFHILVYLRPHPGDFSAKGKKINRRAIFINKNLPIDKDESKAKEPLPYRAAESNRNGAIMNGMDVEVHGFCGGTLK